MTYKLRDWLFSRQRYWGEPVPGRCIAADGADRARSPSRRSRSLLPELDDFKPKGEGFEAPLARVKEWIETTDAQGRKVLPRREHDAAVGRELLVLPALHRSAQRRGAVVARRPSATGDPSTSTSAAPSTRCCTSSTRASGTRCFYDLGLVHTKEPFQKLVNQGMILGESFRFYDDDVSDTAAPRKPRGVMRRATSRRPTTARSRRPTGDR